MFFAAGIDQELLGVTVVEPDEMVMGEHVVENAGSREAT
jgi:hypothetical protein